MKLNAKFALILSLMLSSYAFAKAQPANGICYYDIDDTLTQNVLRDGNNAVIHECLDRNFAVGVITASNRTIRNLCDANNEAVASWMNHDFCQYMAENGKMFNNNNSAAGVLITPAYMNYFKGYDGAKKAYQAKNGQIVSYPKMDDKCVILFDNDNVDIEPWYKDYANNKRRKDQRYMRPDGVPSGTGPNGEYHLAFYLTTPKYINPGSMSELSPEHVGMELDKLIANGCNTPVPAVTKQ